jgi:TetR/AcrR family transcriptional repressor of nem operon
MRRSKQDTAESRRRILDAAARLFRERGVAGVSVADVMAAAGMTHGGFYIHFPSKEALAAAAARHAFTDRLTALADPGSGGVAGYVDAYLDRGHVHSLGIGCPIAGLGSDAARGDGDLRDAVAAGAAEILAALADRMGGGEAGWDRAVRLLAPMLGGLVLARALANPEAQQRVFDLMRDLATAAAGDEVTLTPPT